jgi:chromosome segregation ATPase
MSNISDEYRAALLQEYRKTRADHAEIWRKVTRCEVEYKEVRDELERLTAKFRNAIDAIGGMEGALGLALRALDEAEAALRAARAELDARTNAPAEAVMGEVLAYLLPDRGRWVPPLGDGKVLPVDEDWQKKGEEGAWTLLTE